MPSLLIFVFCYTWTCHFYMKVRLNTERWEKREKIRVDEIVMFLNDTHREKTVFYSVRYKNCCLAASDLFYLVTQSVCTFHYHVLRVQMFEKCDSSKKTVRMNSCSFQQVLRQNLGWFLSKHWKKTRFLRGFILEPTKRA